MTFSELKLLCSYRKFDFKICVCLFNDLAYTKTLMFYINTHYTTKLALLSSKRWQIFFIQKLTLFFCSFFSFSILP